MQAFLATALLCCCAVTARAQTRSINDCERFSNPLAYNQCLASFMPARRHHAGDPPPQVGPAFDPAPGTAAQPPHSRRASRRGAPIARMPSLDSIGRRGSHGRSIATFEVGGSSHYGTTRRSHRR